MFLPLTWLPVTCGKCLVHCFWSSEVPSLSSQASIQERLEQGWEAAPSFPARAPKILLAPLPFAAVTIPTVPGGSSPLIPPATSKHKNTSV